MRNRFPACCMLAVFVAALSFAAETGFLEEFALSADREATIGKLVPGSDEFYFFSCLVAQQKGDADRVAELLGQWRNLHRDSTELSRMEVRQRLLAVDPDDAGSIDEFSRYMVQRFAIRRGGNEIRVSKKLL